MIGKQAFKSQGDYSFHFALLTYKQHEYVTYCMHKTLMYLKECSESEGTVCIMTDTKAQRHSRLYKHG